MKKWRKRVGYCLERRGKDNVWREWREGQDTVCGDSSVFLSTPHTNLRQSVHSTHDDLIHVAVSEDIGRFHHAVFEARPCSALVKDIDIIKARDI